MIFSKSLNLLVNYVINSEENKTRAKASSIFNLHLFNGIYGKNIR